MSHKKIMYVADGKGINRVKVDKETEKHAWVGGKRCSKIRDWYRFFDTFDLAKSYLLREVAKEVEHAQSQLNISNARLALFKSLQE